MKTHYMNPSSERGIALIVVLLLMLVLSGLATGFALTGQVEAQMATNEVYFAGARAAAEAGLNRALVAVLADTSTDWIKGADGAVDASNANAAVNADNGSLSFLLGNGPYYVDANNQYSYTVSILDDDNDTLYETPLTATQRTTMGEDGSAYSNTNDRVILQAIGYGPNGTTIKLARIIETVDTQNYTTTTTTSLSNPAILVNGDLTMNGNPAVAGTSGSVHANGNISIGGHVNISQNITATGTFTSVGGSTFGGTHTGGAATINVPNVQASDYISYANYKLASNGQVQTLQSGVWTQCTTAACKATGWTYNSGTSTWSITGNSAGAGTYYVEGNATIAGNPNGGGNGNNALNLQLSVIATGNITVSGNPKFTPQNSAKIQFVTDKDLVLSGNSDLDDVSTVIEGQIMVREQMSIAGNPEFQGRIIVQNVTSTSSLVTTNSINGNPTITYNGSLNAIQTTTTTTTAGATTYVNNVSGWMEQ